jgi:hypothetical protein
MLVFWQSHAEYQQFVTERWIELHTNHAGNLEYHDALISKLWYPNLDPVLELLAPYYSQSERPAVNQPQILRALVAMNIAAMIRLPAGLKSCAVTPFW